MRAAGGDSDATCDFGNEQRVPPEGREIGRRNIALPVEELLDRQAGGQRADETGAEGDQTVVEAGQLVATTQGGRIGDGQQAAGQSRILPDQCRKLGNRRPVIIDHVQQAQQNLWRRWNPAGFDGVNDGFGQVAVIHQSSECAADQTKTGIATGRMASLTRCERTISLAIPTPPLVSCALVIPETPQVSRPCYKSILL